MKKSLLLLTISCALTVAQGQTNVYHPFPDTNAIWTERMYNIYSNGTMGETRYGIRGDTIINGKNYKKVYSLRDSTIIDLLYAPSTYYAAIREQNKKVYAVFDTIPEQLLYDFNLSLGDTIKYYYNVSPYYGITHNTFSYVVTKIDSALLLDGKYRKRWSLAPGVNCAFSDTIAEGVGSIVWKWGEGLFNPFASHSYVIGYNSEFTCFKKNDTVLYLHNPECNRCFCRLLTAITNEEEQAKILISPNPFSFSTTLQTDKFFNDAVLTVYNLYGQTVKQIKNISGQTVTFHRDNLPSGLYFIRITQDNKTISVDKLVITDN